jgi:LmbE family N-acetylglucosaminyl deacetylase
MASEERTHQRVFVFAHQDDEFGVLAHIEAFVALGTPVWCVYLTDGTARGTCSAVRDAESIRVLVRMGVHRDRIVFAGSRLGIPDGALHRHMAKALEALLEVVRPLQPAALYVPAWEGGHHDHDCTHAVGLLVGRWCAVTDVFQYSLYNGATTRGAWFSVMRPLPANGAVTQTRFSFAAAFRYIGACRAYRSQWRTWLGLFPFFAARLLTRRSMMLQGCSAERARVRPHTGPLYYERRFRVPYDTVAQSVTACERSIRTLGAP